MAASYGYDISGPATTAQRGRAVAVLRLPRRREGAERRGDVAGPHLDVPRRLPAARPRRGPAHRGAGAGARSTTSSSSCGSCGSCAPRSTTSCSPATRPGSPSRSAAWARTAARWSPRPRSGYLQTLYNLGPAPEPNLTVFWSAAAARRASRSSARRCRSTPRAIQYESDDLIRASCGDDAAIACCVSPMRVGKQMQFFGARVNLAKALLYAINGGRDEITGEQVAPASPRPSTATSSTTTTSWPRFDAMMDWLAADLRRRAQRHPLHARQVRLRAPRDGAARPATSCAPWPAASPGCRSSPTPCRRSSTPRSRPVRDETRPGRRLRRRGRLPDLRQRRRPRRRHRGRPGRARSWRRSARTRPTATPCTPSRC